MELLKEWLGSTIAHELNAALQWRMSTPTHIRLGGNNRYQDDGSNLRAKSSKPGVVQIMKLGPIEGPVEAWISDSTFRLKATIAASAVQKFFLKSRKRITQGALGGLIQILDFEIVATHLGPRDSRLTLLINDFKSLGSEGSGLFGSPRPIEVNQEILELLENVKVFRDKELAESGHQTRDVVDESSNNSQNDEDISSDDPLTDQQALATQVPHRQLKNKTTVKKTKAQRSSSQKKLETPSPKVTAVKSGAHLPNLPNSSVNVANEQVSIETAEERAPNIQPSSCQLEKTLESMANEIKKPNNAAALLSLLPRNISFKPAMQPESVNKNPVSSQKPVPGTKGRKKQAEAVEPPETADQRAEGLIIAPESVTLVTEREEGSPREDAKFSALAQESRNSVETTKGSEESMTNKSLHQAFSQISNRISGKDVKIPKDQQDLLERPDSWLPAMPGQRAPIANVPIKTLQVFNRLAENRTTPSPKQTQIASDQGTSVSWSPSPVRDQLPRDSSAEAPVDVREEFEGDSHSKKRGSPNTSTSPSSVASVHRNITRIRSSPSPISAVRGGGLRPFGCPISGCDKSYKRPEALQRHTEYGHSNTVLPKITSRTDTPDSGSSLNFASNQYSCSNGPTHFNAHENLLQLKKKSLLGHADTDHVLNESQVFRKSPCSTRNGSHVKPANVSPARIIEKSSDDFNLQLQPQLTPASPSDQSLSKFGQRELKIEGNLPIETAEEHNSCSSDAQTGIPFSQPELPKDSLRYYSQLKSASPTNHQLISVLSGQSNAMDLSVEDQSIPMSDAESSAQERNPRSSDSQISDKAKDLYVDNAAVQRFPSTASQPEEPILQVKRTPYVNGNISNVDSESLVSHASPSKKLLPKVDIIYDKKVVDTVPQDPVVFDVSSAETQSTKQNEDFYGSDAIDEESIAQQVQHEIDSQHPKNLNISPFQEITNDTIEDTFLPGSADLKTSTKRTSSDAQLLSPNVTKRRRSSKPNDPLKLTQVPQDMPDPSIFGRRFRQEFLASRKISKSKEEDLRHPSHERSTSNASSHIKEEIKMICQVIEDDVLNKVCKNPTMDLGNTQSLHGRNLSVSVEPLASQKIELTPTNMSKEGPQNLRTGHQESHNQSLEIVMLDEDTEDSREKQQPSVVGAISVDHAQPPARINIFDRFKLAYPDFVGNMKQFVAICGKIRDLVKAGRGEHQALWDDFIIRHNTEYPRYLSRCTNEAEDPVPYDQFYRNQIEEPCYVKQIVTRKTLDDALVLRPQVFGHLSTRQQPEHASDSTHVPAALGIEKPTKSSIESPNVPRQILPQATIDLTAESGESSQRGILPPSGKKSSRSLPWIASGIPSAIPPRNQDTPVTPRVLPRTNRFFSHSRSSPSSQMRAGSSRKPSGAALSMRSSRDLSPTAVDLAGAVPPSTTNCPKAETTVDEASKDTNLEDDRLDAQDEWWKDENSPFASFARAYKAIQPGKGNSYARSEPRAGIGKAKLDFLSWYI